jgi:hypothetical protein
VNDDVAVNGPQMVVCIKLPLLAKPPSFCFCDNRLLYQVVDESETIGRTTTVV